MNDREVYSKTESGREEMRTRALQLSGAIRNVLLLVDGKRTLAQIKTLIAGGKAPPDALEQLLRHVRPRASAAQEAELASGVAA